MTHSAEIDVLGSHAGLPRMRATPRSRRRVDALV